VFSAWLTVGTTIADAATSEASAESVFNMVVSLCREAGDWGLGARHAGSV